jgi:hypothetical protein
MQKMISELRQEVMKYLIRFTELAAICQIVFNSNLSILFWLSLRVNELFLAGYS